MNRDAQVKLFADRIDAVVRSTAAEFEVSIAEAVGVLEVIKADLVHTAVIQRQKDRRANPPAGQTPGDRP